MDDLISRKALIETYCEENCGSRKCVDAMDRCVFISHILEQPTVEAVPVVRCKDCVHFDLYLMCCKSRLLNGHTVLEGYCHNGKARE